MTTPSTPAARHGALPAALGAILLWSSLATLGALTRALPPFFVTGICLCLGSLLSVRHIRQWPVPPAIFATGVAGLFGYHFLLFAAFRHAPTLGANLLNYLWPLLIVLLSPLFLPGTRLGWRHIAAALAGFSGAALIVTGGKAALESGHASGYALAAAAALTWACYSLQTRRQPPHPVGAVGGFCLASGLLSLACHVALEPPVSPSALQWLALAGLGLGPMGCAFFLWSRAMQTGDPRQIGALSYLTPMLSTLLLILSGQGTMTPVTLPAIALIMTGAILGARKT